MVKRGEVTSPGHGVSVGELVQIDEPTLSVPEVSRTNTCIPDILISPGLVGDGMEYN